MAFFASSFAPNGGPSTSSNPFKSAGPSTKSKPSAAPAIVPTSSPSTSQSKKRKRPAKEDPSNADGGFKKKEIIQAGQENLERLMKKVGMVGGGGSSKGSPSGNKQKGKAAAAVSFEAESVGGDERSAFDDEEPEPIKKKAKVKYGLDGRPLNAPKTLDLGLPIAGLKKQKQKPPQAKKEVPAQPIPSPSKPTPSTVTKVEASAESAAPMTKLQSSLSNKLESAKFRWINEQLYSRESGEAWEMMKRDGGGAFKDYHKSHRQLTANWPSPPLPYILSLLRPLPSHTLIVDLGCGDAGLAKALVAEGKKVLSFDLVGDVEYISEEDIEEEGDEETKPKKDVQRGRGWVVPCDFLNGVPLPGNPGGVSAATEAVTETKGKKGGKKGESGVASGPEVVDVVVCCLSLMGINWVGGVYEAVRVLKQGGKLHVAEVTSRLISKDGFIKVFETFGLRLDKHSSPTTHFDLFEFTKSTTAPLGAVRGQKGWESRVKGGEAVMKGCVYKRR